MFVYNMFHSGFDTRLAIDIATFGVIGVICVIAILVCCYINRLRFHAFTSLTRLKVLWESTTPLPRKSEIWGFCRQHLATLATPTHGAWAAGG